MNPIERIPPPLKKNSGWLSFGYWAKLSSFWFKIQLFGDPDRILWGTGAYDSSKWSTRWARSNSPPPIFRLTQVRLLAGLFSRDFRHFFPVFEISAKKCLFWKRRGEDSIPLLELPDVDFAYGIFWIFFKNGAFGAIFIQFLTFSPFLSKFTSNIALLPDQTIVV